MRRLRDVGLWGVGGSAAMSLLLALWCLLPVPPALLAPPAVPAFVLADRNGLPLRTVRDADGGLQGWVPLAELDPRLIQAFVALEDRRFYDHPGVDLRGVARAARDNLRAGRVVSGASTITMQLARLLRGSGRGWAGKAHQTLWALRLERSLSKQDILEQYLNRVPLGQGAVGVAAGARLYFGADAAQVGLGEAALLAGIARAPSQDNPLVSPARARARRAVALDRMVAAGFATPEEARRAADEPITAAARARFLAPHFTTRLLQHLETTEEKGLSGTVHSSLDLALQEIAEADVRHTVEVLRDRHVAHAAAVVLENRTGEVLAWVGSPDFWADTLGQVDMVVSARQPGSTLKPFVFGLAFDRGYSAASVLPDVPRVYQTATGPYRPRNYDRVYHGPVRARDALASSYNVPAVELAERLGIQSLLHTLHLAGFASLDRGAEYYGLGLALGSGDVTLLEVANAYRALANGGVWNPVTFVRGDEGWGTGEGERRVVSGGAAALVLDVLADPAARLGGFGAGSALELPFPAAAKTGTSRHYTDNWAVVTTGRFTVAAWVGNFTGRPMRGVSGVTGAAPLAHRLAITTAARYAPGELPAPAARGATLAPVCRLSGLTPGPRCPVATEWFLPGTAPRDPCTWHGPAGVDLPIEYAEWLASAGGAAGVRTELAAAVTLGSGAPPRVAATPSGLRIISPRDGDVYRVPPGTDPRYATIALRAAGARPGEPLRWAVDGRPVAGGRWSLVPGPHEVRVVTHSGDAASARFDVW
jgi:penicillin-binding protein 1C